MHIPSAAILQGNLIPISKEIDPAAAALIEPFACVLRGQEALHIQPGESVLVVGAGPIGMMHVMLAQLRGSGVVIVSELITERAAQAREFGADLVVNPNEQDLAAVIDELTNGMGVDVVIVAAPAPRAQEMAVELAAIGGRINLFGGLPKDHPTIQLNSNLVHYKELVITGTTACSTQDCHRAAVIVNSGQIDLSRLIGVRFPLGEAIQALSVTESGKALKVVLEP
jgi:L-iditol 2-dehydrogenase